jgi:transcriptional regulator with GAF, ATPase, and Fis domain
MRLTTPRQADTTHRSSLVAVDNQPRYGELTHPRRGEWGVVTREVAHNQVAGQGGPSANNEGTAANSDELARQLSLFARSVQLEGSSDDVLDEVVRGAIAIIPGVDEGSISVVLHRKDVISQSPSGELPIRVDALQAEMQEGPCLDAVYEHQTVRVASMADEVRWPKFARKAFAAGAASMLSIQLYVEGDNLGALNLYGLQPYAFDDESERIGLLFATHASVALATAHKLEQLGEGMATRDLIGQAKGNLMERHKITATQAFTLLVRVSQSRNLKLRDVAQQLASSGQLPQLSTKTQPG